MNKIKILALTSLMTIGAFSSLSLVNKEVKVDADNNVFLSDSSINRPVHFASSLLGGFKDGRTKEMYSDFYMSATPLSDRLVINLKHKGVFAHNEWVKIALGNHGEFLYDSKITNENNMDVINIPPQNGSVFGNKTLISNVGKNFKDFGSEGEGFTASKVDTIYNGNEIIVTLLYSELKTMTTSTDNPHIFSMEIIHNLNEGGNLDNCILGADRYFQGISVNGNNTGDPAFFAGCPLLSDTHPNNELVSKLVKDHSINFGGASASRTDQKSQFGWMDNTYMKVNKNPDSLDFSLISIGEWTWDNVKGMNNIQFNIQDASKPTTGGWNLHNEDVALRTYALDENNDGVFTPVVTVCSGFNNFWNMNDCSLFPGVNNFNYNDHVIKLNDQNFLPIDFEQKDGYYTMRFSIPTKMHNTLTSSSIRLNAMCFSGTDARWSGNELWQFSSPNYFDKVGFDAADTANYVTIDSNYTDILQAQEYYFANFARIEGSICHLLSVENKAQAQNLLNWYDGLDENVKVYIDKTIDYDAHINDTVNYIRTHLPNVSENNSIFTQSNSNLAIVVLVSTLSILSLVFFYYLKNRKLS